MATLDFINDGGDKYNFKNATDVVETFIPVRDMIVDYIKDKKVINDVFSNPVDVQYNLDYYSINDFHGNVEMGGKNPGLAKIQTFMKQRRAMNKDSFFVSAGDHFQGTAISNLNEGKVVNEILKEMGLLTSAIGNHEFDFGTDKIPVWAKDGGYLFLASNIEVEESKKPAEWDKYVKPYMIQEVVIEGQTVKIGFIGIATPETAFKTAAENVVGFKFTDPIEATNKYSKILKAQGVDAVIALTHLGGFQKDGKISGEILDYAKGIEGVNAIFLGHTHQLVDGVVNGIPVVQGQYNGRSLSNISLNFSLSGEKVKFNGAKAKVINMTALIETLEDDPAVKAIITKYKNELGPILDKVIGTLKNDLPHDTNTMQVSPMGQFVTKILAEAGGTQIAIMNGGGIRIGFEKGPITMGLMYELLPFDNTLVTLKLSGAELKKIVEHGLYPEEFRPGQFYGLKVWHDKNLKKGQRITSMRLLDGTLIEDSKIYTVSTLDFLITGGDKYDFSKATNVVDSNIPVRDLIADYIEKKQEITYTYVDSLVQGMLSLLSAGVIVGKRKRKEA